MKQYIILSLALLIISMIAACGQKGPLHHPAEPSKSSQNLFLNA
ncbi:MAG: lipoprotein [Candidatus Thiodiazotropha sp.]